MRTISLWQPWATLIAIGAKKIETRSWQTSYRGPLVIHAAKRDLEAKELEKAIYRLLPSDATELRTYHPGTFNYYAIKALYEHHKRPIGSMIPKLPFGALLCVVDLEDCIPTETLVKNISNQEHAFGNYSPGRYGWLLNNVRWFKTPIPCKGQQGIFDTVPPLRDLVYQS